MLIENLFDRVIEAVRGFGLAESTISNNYELLGIKTIRKYYKNFDVDNYCEEVNSAILQDIKIAYQNKQISFNRHKGVLNNVLSYRCCADLFVLLHKKRRQYFVFWRGFLGKMTDKAVPQRCGNTLFNTPKMCIIK